KAQLDFFESKIRPVLANNCYKCHSTKAEKVKGGLLLDSREALLKGGDSGEAIVAGDPEKSLLIKAVRYSDPDLQMPPKGEKLSEQQVADLTAWIRMGAPDPRTASAAQKNWSDPNAKHWAWQPVKKPAVPTGADAGWVKTPLDNFIVAKLSEKGMKPNPAADKRTLIRRVYFDLIGLPPTPDEVEKFVNDSSPSAFEKVVDGLLASPQYGERWGRHWLDTARYADTKGEVRRQREDPNYPFAWTYRDYVIRSFNEDKPYNVFVAEQIAADKLSTVSVNKSNLSALGFLTLGERFQGMQHDIINDRIDVVTKGFLGMTVTCARCHDHKFDPIPQKDYYSLHGIFASSREPEIEPVISVVWNTPEYRDYYEKRIALQQEEQQLEAKFIELRRKRDRDAIRELQKETRQNVGKIARLEMNHPAAPARAMVIEDVPKPKDSPVFIRGEAENKGAIVPRRFLEVLSGPVRPEFKNGSGRLELASAITSKNNPLTARVMINRIWLHHFGEGFVSTPDDFGTMSEAPSHPELLDYLASRFMEEHWSIKKMHKLILMSAVYQQSSANNPRYAQIDPNNRLLWRANIRRLEFEPIRDSLLAIGGTLDKTMYGRPVDLNREPYSTRRSVYGFIDRQNPSDVLVNFDFANPDMTNGKRHQTTVPQQALFFMNGPLVVESAKNLVSRPDFAALSTDEERIRFLYLFVYQRLPSSSEIQLGLDFVSQQPSQERVASTAPAAFANARRKQGPVAMAAQNMKRGGREPMKSRTPLTAWQEYAHALLQGNEFSFVN
ncbi:MAG TPA: PSD1 and planctomycete cytochrome C domain-containing protein, partial [Candidatus Limnocylindria bacterium]|nr:PSD1 and planctomycete cytochrome C domain-containing protein [Candidatus Limnocylindria bacterium]